MTKYVLFVFYFRCLCNGHADSCKDDGRCPCGNNTMEDCPNTEDCYKNQASVIFVLFCFFVFRLFYFVLVFFLLQFDGFFLICVFGRAIFLRINGVNFSRNCGAASVGVLQVHLVFINGLIM